MFEETVLFATRSLELVGVTIIILGAIYSLFNFAKDIKSQSEEIYECLRKKFGRSILLGLEFLVAADIINTVAIDPTIPSVMALGFIVLIRSFLSFSLQVEIDKKLPWK
jgi:uncharacterized membrane protein